MRIFSARPEVSAIFNRELKVSSSIPHESNTESRTFCSIKFAEKLQIQETKIEPKKKRKIMCYFFKNVINNNK